MASQLRDEVTQLRADLDTLRTEAATLREEAARRTGPLRGDGASVVQDADESRRRITGAEMVTNLTTDKMLTGPWFAEELLVPDVGAAALPSDIKIYAFYGPRWACRSTWPAGAGRSATSPASTRCRRTCSPTCRRPEPGGSGEDEVMTRPGPGAATAQPRPGRSALSATQSSDRQSAVGVPSRRAPSVGTRPDTLQKSPSMVPEDTPPEHWSACSCGTTHQWARPDGLRLMVMPKYGTPSSVTWEAHDTNASSGMPDGTRSRPSASAFDSAEGRSIGSGSPGAMHPDRSAAAAVNRAVVANRGVCVVRARAVM